MMQASRTYDEERLHGSVLLLSVQAVDPVESFRELGGASRSLVGLLTGDGHDTPDPLGDRRFLGDDKVLDFVSLADVTTGKGCFIRIRSGAKSICTATHVPPQNSTLVCFHLGFSMSEVISSKENSRVTTLTGSG
jgi:hypothetical protein